MDESQVGRWPFTVGPRQVAASLRGLRLLDAATFPGEAGTFQRWDLPEVSIVTNWVFKDRVAKFLKTSQLALQASEPSPPAAFGSRPCLERCPWPGGEVRVPGPWLLVSSPTLSDLRAPWPTGCPFPPRCADLCTFAWVLSLDALPPDFSQTQRLICQPGRRGEPWGGARTNRAPRPDC